jgi:hypothetical protein
VRRFLFQTIHDVALTNLGDLQGLANQLQQGGRGPKPARAKEFDWCTIQFSDEILAERDATPHPTFGHVPIVRDQPCDMPTLRQGDVQAHALPPELRIAILDFCKCQSRPSSCCCRVTCPKLILRPRA